MEFTVPQIVWTALVSSGVVGGIWTLFVFITGRLDIRRKRIAEERAKDISSSADIGRLKLESESHAHDLLWKIIEEHKQEIKDLRTEVRELKAELEAAENDERLKRPDVMHIYECVRQIKNEMDSLNIMLLSDEETNVFARRWGNIKTIMVDLESTLAGQRKKQEEKERDEHSV